VTTLPTVSAPVIESGRVVLRKARDADREGIVEVMTDPEVRGYLGGPRPRADVERFLDAAGLGGATAGAGSYVIADRQTDRFLGTLRLDRRAAGRPGHVTVEGGELELSYVLRRGAWGAGLAFEAATAALRTAAAELPDQPVLVVTQSANDRSRGLAGRLGFREVGEFEEFGAAQVLAVAPLESFRAATAL
jgi:RimJ/RimL family protein N-acetyltransferase